MNTATAAELRQRLGSVGRVLAERIVAHREEHGPFSSVWDLGQVKGIDKRLFDGFSKDCSIVFGTPQDPFGQGDAQPHAGIAEPAPELAGHPARGEPGHENAPVRTDRWTTKMRALRLGDEAALQDQGRAFQIYRDALAEIGDDRELLSRALGCLRRRQDARLRAELLERLHGIDPTGDDVALALRAAWLYESLSDFAAAARVQWAANRRRMQRRLIEQARLCGQHETVIEMLCRAAADEPSPAAGAAWLQRAAGVCLAELRDPSRAVQLLLSACELAPEEPTLQNDLARALESAAAGDRSQH